MAARLEREEFHAADSTAVWGVSGLPRDTCDSFSQGLGADGSHMHTIPKGNPQLHLERGGPYQSQM